MDNPLSRSVAFHDWCGDPSCVVCAARQIDFLKTGKDPYQKKIDKRNALLREGRIKWVGWGLVDSSEESFSPAPEESEGAVTLPLPEVIDLRRLFKRAPSPLTETPAGDLLVQGENEIIYEDPPWRFKSFSMTELAKRGEKWGRAKGRPVYDTLNHETLCQIPVEKLAAKKCARLTWATFPKLNEAIEYVEYRRRPTRKEGETAPIFEYKTVAFVWLKTTPKAFENFKRLLDQWMAGKKTQDDLWAFFLASAWHFGCGYWSHANAEVCLLSTKGKPSRAGTKVSQLIVSPVSGHSEKPRETYDRIEELLGKKRRIELFARKENPPPDGWAATGLDYDGLDVFDALGAKEWLLSSSNNAG